MIPTARHTDVSVIFKTLHWSGRPVLTNPGVSTFPSQAEGLSTYYRGVLGYIWREAFQCRNTAQFQHKRSLCTDQLTARGPRYRAALTRLRLCFSVLLADIEVPHFHVAHKRA